MDKLINLFSFMIWVSKRCEIRLKNPPLQLSSDISDDSALDEDLLGSNRMENLHWCKCMSHCVILHTLIECKCCREYDKLLGSKLNNIECITQHEEFHTLCINKTVLEK